MGEGEHMLEGSFFIAASEIEKAGGTDRENENFLKQLERGVIM